MASLAPTFLAALRAVGTASTMAFAGFYLHRRGFVTPSGQKMMALLSQQVTIPAFLFAKIIYCPTSNSSSRGVSDVSDVSDGGNEREGSAYGVGISISGGDGNDGGEDMLKSAFVSFESIDAIDSYDAFDDDARRRSLEEYLDLDPHDKIVCPSVADRISDLWVILFWPIYVVFCGLVVGYVMAKLSNTPSVQIRSCLASCAFGNSTGLVMTLLTVIHGQFPDTTELGSIDPTAFLSVYLLLYPVLQWGVGGWLLAPDEKEDKEVEMKTAGETSDKLERGIPNVNNADDMFGADQFQRLNNQGHRRNHTIHISHLLNYETRRSFTSAVAAGQEEFGGVPPRHIYIPVPLSGGDATTNNRKPQFAPARVLSSHSGFALMMKELSFDNFSTVPSSSFEQLPSNPSLTKMPLGQNQQNGQNSQNNLENHTLDTTTMNGDFVPTDIDHDQGPLMIDASGETNSSASVSASTGTPPNILNMNPPTIHENVPLLSAKSRTSSYNAVITNGIREEPINDKNATSSIVPSSPLIPKVGSQQQIQSIQDKDVMPLTETLGRVAMKVFQPPVIGALAGLFIASFPSVRGMFVNIWGDKKPAPFQWMFDGIYSVGEAAVPINMAILGINLSSTFQKKKPSQKAKSDGENLNAASNMLDNTSMLAALIGKMIIMPAIGILSTWILQLYFIEFPDEIDATCYLVMMIVFITPTANNVMVMVELSGSSSKEGIARLIGWQYLVSPVVLSIVLSAVVSLASCHFDTTTPYCM